MNRPLVGPLANLATITPFRRRRVSSWDRTGGNQDCFRIAEGERTLLADIAGAGCIWHIWFAIGCDEPHYLRRVLLRAYWDGEESPSIEAPVGDFFGVGHAIAHPFVSLPLNMVKETGRGTRAGMNCFFPMPYAQSARMEVINEGKEHLVFYYYIDYEEYESLSQDQGRFHAWWNRENPCQAVRHPDPKREINLTGADNYLILEAEGMGHYVGCVLSVDNINAFHQNYTWFGEGDDMIFIDGEEWPPSLHGTGTEDYFCSAWGFPCGQYSGPYHGVALPGDTAEWSGKWTVYRFHIEDPVYFEKSIRVTLEHGHANDQGNDYSSVAYWYQREPHRPFPPMPQVAARLPR